MQRITRWVETVTERIDLPARALMALLFLASGFGKVTAVGPTQAYMAAYGVPGFLSWPAAALELTGGALLLAGLAVRPLSLVLAGWCVLTAAIFHTAWSDQIQQMMLLKNLTMAGGFLMLAKSGSWSASLDARLAAGRQRL
ncbi:MAG: DoxX family protein, partial [Alphaproteobacteria bacterium]|nr:DoxX family protein [Alphaproteobacteria bacterium]